MEYILFAVILLWNSALVYPYINNEDNPLDYISEDNYNEASEDYQLENDFEFDSSATLLDSDNNAWLLSEEENDDDYRELKQRSNHQPRKHVHCKQESHLSKVKDLIGDTHGKEIYPSEYHNISCVNYYESESAQTARVYMTHTGYKSANHLCTNGCHPTIGHFNVFEKDKRGTCWKFFKRVEYHNGCKCNPHSI